MQPSISHKLEEYFQKWTEFSTFQLKQLPTNHSFCPQQFIYHFTSRCTTNYILVWHAFQQSLSIIHYIQITQWHNEVGNWKQKGRGRNNEETGKSGAEKNVRRKKMNLNKNDLEI